MSVDDLYDFSGCSLDDLSLLRTSMLMATSSATNALIARPFGLTGHDPGGDDDDEEWYPPTPPPYDVTERLLEANRDLEEDPTSCIHVPGRLKWRPDQDDEDYYDDEYENDDAYDYEDDFDDDIDDDEDEKSSRSHKMPLKPSVEIVEKTKKMNRATTMTTSGKEIVIFDDFASLKRTEEPRRLTNGREDSLTSSESLSGLSTRTSSGGVNNTSTVTTTTTSTAAATGTMTMTTPVSDGRKSRKSYTQSEKRPLRDTSNLKSYPKEGRPNSSSSCESSTSSGSTSDAANRGRVMGRRKASANMVQAGATYGANNRHKDYSGSGSGSGSSSKRSVVGVAENNAYGAKVRSRSADQKTLPRAAVAAPSARPGVPSYQQQTFAGLSRQRRPASPSPAALQSSVSQSARIAASCSLPDLKSHTSGDSSSSASPPIRKPLHVNYRPLLPRKASRQSLSSSCSSSVSSQSPSEASEETLQQRRLAADRAFEAWVARKREEKKLRERRSYLQARMNRKQVV